MCKTENQYRDSLHRFLKGELLRSTGKEVKFERSRGDIVIGKTVIELKANLNSTGEVQRAIGQVELYKPKRNINSILLVVCNVIDEDLFKQLKNKYRFSAFKIVEVIRK